MNNIIKTAEWQYKTQDGHTIGLVDRLEPKNIEKSSKIIIPRFVKNNQGEFIPGLPDELKENKPIYGLHTLDRKGDIYIVEGEKCAELLISLGYTCLTTLGGSNSATKVDWSVLKDIKDREVILLPDNDEAGFKYMKEIYYSLKRITSLPVSIADIYNDDKGSDVCDCIQEFIADEFGDDWDGLTDINKVFTNEAVLEIKDCFEMLNSTYKRKVPIEWKVLKGGKGLNCISFNDFVDLDIPDPDVYLSPWLTNQSLTMIYANRGVGKTYFALNCAYALASGKSFLKYDSNSQVSVMYIDGEMQAPLLIKRLKSIVDADKGYLPMQIITPDLQNDRGMPDLSTYEGQEEVDELIKIANPSIIFIDNLSTLCRTGKENDSESWNMVQSWAIKHRSQGRSIVFIHHANKSGGQRGSSKKEDILDNVIFLQRPEDYDEAKDGAKFEIIFEKNRSLFGKDVAPILASLSNDGHWSWEYTQTKDEKALAMLESGMKQKEIAQELGISASAVSKMINRAKEARLNA